MLYLPPIEERDRGSTSSNSTSLVPNNGPCERSTQPNGWDVAQPAAASFLTLGAPGCNSYHCIWLRWRFCCSGAGRLDAKKLRVVHIRGSGADGGNHALAQGCSSPARVRDSIRLGDHRDVGTRSCPGTR